MHVDSSMSEDSGAASWFKIILSSATLKRGSSEGAMADPMGLCRVLLLDWQGLPDSAAQRLLNDGPHPHDRCGSHQMINVPVWASVPSILTIGHVGKATAELRSV